MVSPSVTSFGRIGQVTVKPPSGCAVRTRGTLVPPFRSPCAVERPFHPPALLRSLNDRLRPDRLARASRWRAKSLAQPGSYGEFVPLGLSGGTVERSPSTVRTRTSERGH